MEQKLVLSVLPEVFAIVRLEPDAGVPEWCDVQGSTFTSITRTSDELAIVCPQEYVPSNAKVEKDWQAFKVEGQLGFSVNGIVESLAKILADVDVSILFISTYDTDYVFVKQEKLEIAIKALSEVCDVREVA